MSSTNVSTATCLPRASGTSTTTSSSSPPVALHALGGSLNCNVVAKLGQQLVVLNALGSTDLVFTQRQLGLLDGGDHVRIAALRGQLQPGQAARQILIHALAMEIHHANVELGQLVGPAGRGAVAAAGAVVPAHPVVACQTAGPDLPLPFANDESA